MQYHEPAVYEAALAKGSARWGSRFGSPLPENLTAASFGGELLAMYQLANLALADNCQPRYYPVVATMHQHYRYAAMTADLGMPRGSDWECDVRDALALAWAGYRGELEMEMSAADEEREPAEMAPTTFGF